MNSSDDVLRVGRLDHHAPAPPMTPAPISLLRTGFASAECSLGIDGSGTLYVGPAFGRSGVGILRSRDRGQSWEFRRPGPHAHRRIQPFTYVDQTTGRLFFKTARFDVMPPRPLATGYDLSVSDDQGQTWTQQVIGHRMRDWSKVQAGPAPADDPDQRRLTYLTGPTPFSTRVWPLIAQRHQAIYSSRDGGTSWEAVTGPDRLNIDPARAPGMSRWEHINYGNGVVDKAGTLWLAGRHGTALGVASSRTRGERWTVSRVPGSELRTYRNPLHYILRYSNYLLAESIAVDCAGTVLTVWPDADDALRGAWSTDGGMTWSEPALLAAPGVDEVRYTSVIAKPGSPGTFALAYYGRDRTQGRSFTAYLTELTGVGVDGPIESRGGPITEPGQALFPRGFDPGYLRIMFGGDLNEILQARYAPDGTLYLACAMRISAGNRRTAWHTDSRRTRNPVSNPMQAVVARMDPVNA